MGRKPPKRNITAKPVVENIPVESTDSTFQRRIRRLALFLTLSLFFNYRYWTGKQNSPLLCTLFGVNCPKINISGTVAPGLEPVVSAFKSNFMEGSEIGASFTAYVAGKKVVELYGGYTSQHYKKPFDSKTLTLVFSSSKVIEGIVIAYLINHCRLNYTDLISTHWPEFAQNLKEKVTLADLLGHRAGVTYLDTAPSLVEIGDLDAMATLLAKQRHNFGGEVTQGYHAVTRGWYLNEIVRRVDVKKRSMGRLIREELMPLLDAEFYLGIPLEHEHRISPLHGVPVLRSLANFLTPNIFRSTPLPAGLGNIFNRKSIGFKALFSQPRQIVPWPHSHNRKQIWRSESPSFSGITNSASLAAFAALMANNGTLNSHSILSPSTVDLAHSPLPWMPDSVVKRNVTFSRGGWGIEMTFPNSTTKWTGWGGVGGSLVFWNREKGLAFAYVMNSLGHTGIGDARGWKLIEAFEKAAEGLKL